MKYTNKTHCPEILKLDIQSLKESKKIKLPAPSLKGWGALSALPGINGSSGLFSPRLWSKSIPGQ